MSTNTSSSSSSSSSSSTMYSMMLDCMCSPSGLLNVTAFTITNTLVVLPFCIAVLHLGVQRRRQRRPGAVTSHSDFFTYHMVATELVGIVGFILLCCGIYADQPILLIVSLPLSAVNLNGQIFFHVLTCVERYLAVMHPITYRNMREAKGIRIRNVTICCVWLFSLATAGCLLMEEQNAISVIAYSITAVTITVTCFCSVSVLCALIRPGPGDGGGGRPRIDPLKLRAFFTIMAILGVMVVRFVINIFSTALRISPQLGETGRCSATLAPIWFGLPSSLILPLLFLQRAGKLVCCKSNESGQGSG